MNAPPPRRRALPSLLSRGARRARTVALVLAGFMLANTAYLLANRLADLAGVSWLVAGRSTLPVLFQTMVLTHTGIGLLLATAMVVFLLVHLPQVWKRRHPASIVSGIGYTVVGAALVITGLFILTDAASRANRWAWWVHVVAALAAPAGYAAHRLVSYVRPPAGVPKRFIGTVIAGAVALLAIHVVTDRPVRPPSPPATAGAVGRDVAQFADSGFVPAAFVPPESPFFPAATTTSSGSYLPARVITRGEDGSPDTRLADLTQFGFVHRTAIGAATCRRCHQDIVAQWETSAHRFASFNNPFYEATIDDLRANATAPNPFIDAHRTRFGDDVAGVGEAKSKWCSGCHDPALMMAGAMGKPVDRASPEAQAGLTCLACHAIDRVHNQTGNGAYNLADEQPDPYLFPNAPTGSLRAWVHDAVVKAKPTVHRRQMLTPVFREAVFCSACHKVSLDAPVNNYRWLRGQNEFDNWDDSGVALNASRTFYLPARRRVCQDCHMPPEPAPLGDVAADAGMVRSHRFLAVNTALPFIRGDTATVARIEEFLRDERLRVDVFAVRTGGDPIMAADRSSVALVANRTNTVDIVVRNVGVGHTFPGGTNDSNEGWLEVTVVDDRGATVLISGAIGPDGRVDPTAHMYNALILDRDGNPITRRNAQDIFTTVYANVIPPGTADLAHFEFTPPRSWIGRTVTIRARLLWRKFTRDYTVFAYRTNREGFRAFDDVPDLPVTEIAAAELTVAVRADPGAAAADPIPADWERYNDYGIASLREGNTRVAAAAFTMVARLRPEQVDGPLNLARAALQDGNLGRAYDHLRRSEEIAAGDARAAWVWGSVLQEDGRYEQAAAAYRRVLERFPGDRAAWRSLGRTLYLDRRYEDALVALDRVLEIDPEDRVAHYHRMLSLRALGREAEAEVAEEAAAYYGIDESAQEVTRTYRQQHPGANAMAQSIRTHTLTPPTP